MSSPMTGHDWPIPSLANTTRCKTTVATRHRDGTREALFRDSCHDVRHKSGVRTGRSHRSTLPIPLDPVDGGHQTSDISPLKSFYGCT